MRSVSILRKSTGIRELTLCVAVVVCFFISQGIVWAQGLEKAVTVVEIKEGEAPPQPSLTPLPAEKSDALVAKSDVAPVSETKSASPQEPIATKNVPKNIVKNATGAEVIQAPTATVTEKVPEAQPKVKRIPSVFYTYWQHQSILDAMQSRGSDISKIPEAFLDKESGASEDEKLDKPQNREITLGGIVYTADKDWTIWLNDIRVTPNAIPSELIELKVYKDHIDMKWYDKYSNKIFPIRLRPHQRFHLDTRVFLPG